MSRPHILSLLAAALGLTALVAQGKTPPFSIDTQDGQWKPSLVQKSAAPGIIFEMVVTHVGTPGRLLVFSSAKLDSQPEGLNQFAHRLRDSFTDYRSTTVTERDSTEIGYTGRTLDFELVSEKVSLDCELFVFADEETWWGVLYAKPADAPTAAVSPFRLLHKSDKAPPGVVALEPFRVKGVPATGFPISIGITRSNSDDRIVAIEVTDLPVGSITEREGIKIGDAIVAIDGRKIADFAAGVGKDSELGRIFLNRKPGDAVKLEILPADAKKSFFVTLHIPSNTPFSPGNGSFRRNP